MKIIKHCTLLCAYIFFITTSLASGTSDVISNLGDDALSSIKEDYSEAYSTLQSIEEGYELPAAMRCEVGDVGVELTIDGFQMNRTSIDAGGGDVILDAEAAFALPFSISSSGNNIIRFEGKGISMDGSMSEETKIFLKSDIDFVFLENKIKLKLKKEGDDRCWISFDCKGVQNGQISGDFVFDESFVSPAERNEPVTASFSFNLGDGFISKVNFSQPFKVANCGDFVFEVTDAVVDLSSTKNASGFVFPTDYWDESAGDPVTWNGFFLKNLTVTVPKDLSFNEKKTDFIVKNLLIDDYGLTGDFMMAFSEDQSKATNQNPGLDFSVDTIGVSIWQNELSDGMISGKATVPFLKEDSNSEKQASLNFKGSFGYSDRFYYNINAGIDANTKFGVPFTKIASVTINKGSYLDIGNKNDDNGFVASLCLNGSLNVESEFQLKGVKFEGLKFSTSSPHVDIDHFGLDGKVGLSFAGFGISLNKLELNTKPTNIPIPDLKNPLDLRIDAQLGLAQEGSWGISAGAGFDIYSDFNERWKYEDYTVDQILLDMDFSAFHFKGDIKYNKYNKDTTTEINSEFRGGLLLEIKALSFGVNGDVIFGRTKSKETYFYTKAATELPSGIVLFPPCVFAKSFMGGLYYKMSTPRKDTSSNTDFKPINFDDKDNYSYDPKAGFGFLAGMGIYVAEKSLVSANANLELSFNSHWGLNFIRLNGFASFLSETSLGATKDDANISATLNSIYDRPNRTFEAQLQGDINYGKILSGQANALLHTDPDKWHFWLGTRRQPNNLKFAGFAKSQSYFMMGEIESPLLPLNETVAAKAGITLSPAQGKEGEISSGKGFAFGVDMSVGAKVSIPLDILYAGFNLSGGSDLMVIKNENRNIWEGSGDIYVYADGSVGASVPWLKWCKWHPCIRMKKFSIFNGTTFATLYGSGPTPFTGKGKLNFECSIFCIDLPSVDVSVSF